jgi:signal transduction histidine kinase
LRLARLIDELLDVSRSQAGQLRLSRERSDLVAAVHRVVGRFRDELTAKGIEIAVHATSPVFGCWDPLRIEQVIANLISNSIKYGAGRGVRVTCETNETSAILRVEDQGIGMDAPLVARLFKPFGRGVATGQIGGLGLGLYITAQIVHAHGGAISVRSTPGEGSTVIVELPREAAS